MLAIVVPFYKHTFFEDTLQSLAAQTCQDFKVYIGDDASPNSPIDLLEQFGGQFDFVYHRFETNLGGFSLTQQWKRCIDLSGDEEWLMILGDDDVLDKNVIEEFYKNIIEVKEQRIDVIRFSTQKIDEHGSAFSDVYFHPKTESATDFLFRKTRSSLSEYVFKKRKVVKIGFKNFSLGWFSDVLAVLEFSDFGAVFTINESLVFIRISNDSISGKQDNFKLKSSATFDFYYYLLKNKNQIFDKLQNKELKKCICKAYLNDKKHVLNFLKIFWLYMTRGWVNEYFSFIKAMFLNLLKINVNRLQSAKIQSTG